MKPPCYGCQDRHIAPEGMTCHHTCGRYKLYRLLMDKKHEAKLRATMGEADYISYKRNILKEPKDRRRNQ